jgi:hypothetical protein
MRWKGEDEMSDKCKYCDSEFNGDLDENGQLFCECLESQIERLQAENARLHSILVDIFKFTACPSDRKWSDYSYSVLGARLDEIAKLVSPPEVS